MQPIGKRVLVRHAKMGSFIGKEKLLVAPPKFRGSATEGIIIKMGTQCPDDGELQPGDRVLFSKVGKHVGQVVELGSEKVRLVHYDEIVAKVDVGRLEVCEACQGQGVLIPKKTTALSGSSK